MALSQRGTSLIETMVGVGLLTTIMAGTGAYLNYSMHESAKLSENLAKMDLERQVTSALSIPTICSKNLTPPNVSAPIVFDSTKGTGGVFKTVDLGQLVGGSASGPASMAKKNDAVSAMAKEFFKAHFFPAQYSWRARLTNSLNYYLAALLFTVLGVLTALLGIWALRNFVKPDPVQRAWLAFCQFSGKVWSSQTTNAYNNTFFLNNFTHGFNHCPVEVAHRFQRFAFRQLNIQSFGAVN